MDRPPAGPFSMLAAPLCAVLLVCLAAVPAAAAPQLIRSPPLKIDAAALTGISCASESLCAAVDGTGGALLSADPSAGASAKWNRREIDPGAALTGVSCASTSLCVAVDAEGHALITTNPAAGAAATWSPQQIDGKTALTGVSCASTSLCVAVDSAGHALASGEPAGGATTWRGRPIDLGASLVAVSCAPAPAGVCVAVDGAGDALASGNPTAAAPTWSWTPAFVEAPAAPTAVSCAGGGLCVSVDSGGDSYVSDNPTAAAPSWAFASIDSPTALSGVSCTTDGLCATVDGAGRVLVAQTPPPTVATTAPSALAETAATLTGTVNPQDATLATCRFEYGPSEAYGQSAPCAVGGAGAVPNLAGGAAQAVSATLGGLAANATYHYRLVAGGAGGTATTPDATFKTLAPPLAQPHPSISGVPARGQQLTCRSGVTVAGAAVSYTWLRDTRGIAGADDSTYSVQDTDVTHHLQCRVTATNAAGSASATSAFVTVPAGGLGSISETQVGPPRVAGATVSVLVTCSPQAAGSCAIALRLTVVETLRGSHAIAVVARRVRRVTVTVGASGARVPAGQRRTVTVALNATGRGLLARLRRLPARLSVRGTVVGAIIAPLRSATVTLGGAGKASFDRASTRHRR